jgi:serine/threonine-protein kinase RsbT
VTADVVVVRESSYPILTDLDVLAARRAVRDVAAEIGLSTVDLTKIVTASSELARNTLIHGGGGMMHMELLRQPLAHSHRDGVRVCFSDKGKGIPDISLAMRDGFSTGRGMGIGLPGSKRLVHEFDVTSTPSQGTRVTIVRWKT